MEILQRVPRDLRVQNLRSIFRQSFFAHFKGVSSRTKTPNLASEQTFKPLCDFYQFGFPKYRYAVIEDPRNHAKTSIEMSFIDWLGTQRPNPQFDSEEECARAEEFLKYNPLFFGVDGTYLFASGSDRNATSCSTFMRSVYETDDFHRRIWPDLTPEYAAVTGENLTWNIDNWQLPGRRERHPQGYIETAGVGTRLAMRHFKGIFFDDPINEQNWKSLTDIEKAKTWIKLAHNLLEVNSIDHPLASFFWITGNCWSDHDVVTWIAETMPKFKIWRRACWVCSKCGRQNCIGAPDCQFTRTPLWEERYTENGLIELRAADSVIFAAQYENQPYNKDTCKFNLDMCGEFVYDAAAKELVVFAKDRNAIVKRLPIGMFRGVMSYDPATSMDPKSCRSALTLTLEDTTNGDVYFMDLWADQAGVTIPINTILDRYEYWVGQGLHIRHVGFEAVAGQKFVLPALIMAARLRGISALSVEPDNKHDYNLIYMYKTDRGVAKEDRIANLIGWRIAAGKLYIRRDLPQLQLFRYEAERFPNAKTVDCLDALAYAEQCYLRPVEDAKLFDRVREHNLRMVNTRAHLPF